MENTPSESCPNCGDPGNPGHHWLSQPGVYEGYICIGEDTDKETQ